MDFLLGQRSCGVSKMYNRQRCKGVEYTSWGDDSSTKAYSHELGLKLYMYSCIQ